MPEPQETYTHRGGERVPLEKAPDQFVVRALPEILEAEGIDDAKGASSHTSRVTTRPAWKRRGVTCGTWLPPHYRERRNYEQRNRS